MTDDQVITARCTTCGISVGVGAAYPAPSHDERAFLEVRLLEHKLSHRLPDPPLVDPNRAKLPDDALAALEALSIFDDEATEAIGAFARKSYNERMAEIRAARDRRRQK